MREAVDEVVSVVSVVWMMGVRASEVESIPCRNEKRHGLDFKQWRKLDSCSSTHTSMFCTLLYPQHNLVAFTNPIDFQLHA